MKKSTLLVLCLLTFAMSFAQKKAVTENGEEVILYDDGTWDYLNSQDYLVTQIPINPKAFEKGENSTFLLKSNRLNVGFWLDPKAWSFRKSTENPDAEYEFNMKEEDLYGMVLTEKFEIPLQSLKLIAVENAKEVAPDLKIVKEEYRNVNGLKVLLLHMNGTMQGIKVSYYGYYYSNETGTVQFITYTSQNLMNTLIEEGDKLLNGIVVVE
ncbi:MAG TPA: hypothetical protein VKX34_05135 [Aequorivita sp.]|nr:hypothetical protein [Aequorivita sp.]